MCPFSQIQFIKIDVSCDKPVTQRKKDFDNFCEAYKYLIECNQLFVLPTLSIEEYYPGPWKKNSEEAKQLEKERKKTAYALEVGKAILQEEFEENMCVVHEALKRAWANSY